MELLGVSDAFGNTQLPLYVMNVTYPVVDDEIVAFCEGKRAVLLVEEGQPDYIEQNLNAILRRNKIDTELHGKDMLPVAGEYTSAAMTAGLAAFLHTYAPDLIEHEPSLLREPSDPLSPFASRVAPEVVQPRPPGLCTGCPERPIFSGMKLAERETGEHHVSADIGCHLFAINAPFDLGATTMGYGLGSAGAAALSAEGSGNRSVAFMGDGGFWHNGLTSGVGNAVFNKSDQLLVVVDNAYAAATGGQDLLSSQAQTPTRSTQHPIEKAARGVGVEWARTITDTFDVTEVRDNLQGGAHHRGGRPQGDRDAERVPAQPPTPGQARDAQGAQGGQARHPRAVRRRPRDLHRRPRLHPHLGLPLADHHRQPRPDAHPPGRDRARRLRRLRGVRGQRPRRRALPVVLSLRRRAQPDHA